MIIRGTRDAQRHGRTFYALDGFSVPVDHFVVRETTAENPFVPHRHEKPELWYIIGGEAVVSLGGQEHSVETGDLIRLDPWVEHGLRTSNNVRWICLG